MKDTTMTTTTTTKDTTTAPALGAGEELAVEIRRGERLLGHYGATRQHTLTEMLARDLKRARHALAAGDGEAMARQTRALRGYEGC